jgi:NDP-sugar pyrophosphorylase family protein
MKKEIAIIYMVAGISSRFGGKIKQFARIGPDNETLIEYSLNQALKSGFSKIIFIVGNLTEIPFKEKFGYNYQGIPVYYVLQKYNPKTRDKPWGTADAACSITEIIDCPFVLCNGDDIYGENTFRVLYNHLINKDSYNIDASVGYKIEEILLGEILVNRGVFNIKNNFVKSILEIFGINIFNYTDKGLNKDSLVSMNIYALHENTVFLLSELVRKFKEKNSNSRTIECLLPNIFTELIAQEKIKMKIYPSVEKWYGITSPIDEMIIKEELIRKK